MAGACNLNVEAFYTGLLFDLVVSVLNIDFAHRHIGFRGPMRFWLACGTGPKDFDRQQWIHRSEKAPSQRS